MFVLAALVYVCASRSLAVPVKKSGHVKSMGALLDLCVSLWKLIWLLVGLSCRLLWSFMSALRCAGHSVE